MADLIERSAAIAVADSSDYVGLSVDDVKKVTDEVVKGLKWLPSVDAVPVVHGRWNVYCHTPKDFSYSCNQCGYSAPYGLYGGEYSQKKWNFCPHCGAKMEVEHGRLD